MVLSDLFLLNAQRGEPMSSEIVSISNKKIKLAAGLKKRRQREKTGLFAAEGIRLCEMAAKSDWQIEFGFYTSEIMASNRGRELLQEIKNKCQLSEVPVDIYKKVSSTETPQGIMLVLKQKNSLLAELKAVSKPLYVVMDGVQDPGNAGTIIRTADAIGADGVIMLKGSVDVFSDKTVRSTMGSLFHLPICTDVTHDELLEFAQLNKIVLYATALDAAAEPHFAQNFNAGCAIILGNEGNGVSEYLLAEAKKTYIPMYGQAESLNVGVSAAVVLYEAVRQRHFV